MKKKRLNSSMPIGKLTKVEDFLPPPEKLVIPENTVKVTLRMNKSTVEFFKEQAKKCHTKYQRMIRSLLDKYSEKFRLQH